ncbi:hypothetical protein RYX36_036980 [Vicia faba]
MEVILGSIISSRIGNCAGDYFRALGQQSVPVDVFPSNSSNNGDPSAFNMPQYPAQLQFGSNGMLDDWEENLAVITANRTKDDELVIIHLGDCL